MVNNMKKFPLPPSTDDKSECGLSRHIEVLVLAGQTSQSDQILLFAFVLAHVLLGALEDLAFGLLLLLLVEDDRLGAGRSSLGVCLAFLEEGLWDLRHGRFLRP